MNRIFSVLLSLFFFSVNSLPAQAPALIWQKCLGGKLGEYANSVEPTSDGGFIVAGYTEGQDNGDVMGYHGNPGVGDIWIVKTDNTGNIQWQKCLGGTFFETGTDIHQTADGGFILAGTSASVDCNITGNHGGTDYWVVKLNSKGDVIWQKLYGGSKNEYAYGLSQTPDGGYMVTGETESSDGDITLNHGLRDYWIIRIDGSGNLLWQKSLGGSGMDEAYSVQATPDGGCITAGYTESNDGDVSGNHGKRDYWVVKLNNTGAIQWQKSLGGSEPDGAWSVQLTNDGGYIVTGYAGSNNGDVSGNHQALGAFSDFWVVKLNSAGSLVWQSCYGGDLNEIAYFIQPTQDGGYLVCGSAESSNGNLTCNAGITDMWLIKISSSGVLQWQENLGGNLYDEAHCIKELSDGSYIVAGNTCSQNVSGHHAYTGPFGTCDDFWLIRLSAAGSPVPAPVITINPASGNVCAGLSATLSTSILYGGTNPTFQWTRNGIPVGSNLSTYTSSAFGDNDQITCRVTSGGACQSSSAQSTATLTLHVITNTIDPQIKITADNTFVCPCTTVTFKASLTNAGASPVYQWKVNGINAGNNSNLFITNTLVQGDVVTCVFSDNTSCLANGPVISNSIQMNASSGTLPSVSISTAMDTICSGSMVTFTANAVNAGANPAYQWKVNGANAGTNNAVFTNSSFANGDIISCVISTDPLFPCAAAGNASSNSVKMTVVLKGAPAISISASQDTICTGAPVTFMANSSLAGANPSYQWKINGVAAGTNSKSFITSSLANADIVTCLMTVDPSFGCATNNNASSNSIIMTVKAQANPTVSITASANDVCAGEPIRFNASAQNAGTSPSYQWILNNQSIQELSPVFTSNTLANGDAVFCTVTPGNDACSLAPISSNTILAIVKDVPGIVIYPPDTLINIGQQVELRAMVTGNIASYQWSPADKLQDPSTYTPSTVSLTDNTTFTLVVKNDKGCEASSSAIIKVGRTLIMPNAFTPNGDGFNDVFRIPVGVVLQLKEFSIFDRWGMKVFTTHKISEGWNGTYNGIPAVSGIYVYYILGTNQNGNVFQKGTVALIR